MHCLGERGVEGGKCSTSFFEVRKRAAVNQTSHGNCFKSSNGENSERRDGAYYAPSRACRYHLELKRTYVEDIHWVAVVPGEALCVGEGCSGSSCSC